MKGVVLVTGAVLLASVIYPADSGTTYHVAFLGRSPVSTGTSIGLLQYQSSSDPATTSEVGSCSWKPVTSGSSNIKQMQPSGDCGGHVPDGFALKSSGLKVESEDDGIILHVFQTDASGALSDGFLAIPDNHLGNEYYVITYCTLGGFCQFAVAGTTDGTSVNIVFPSGMSAPNVTCNGVQLPDSAPSGQPVPFTLNEFDVLHIESESDLTGTYISSDHSVSVFVGARDVPSISGSNSSMIEQIPPINKWGTDFVVGPNYLNEAGDVIKIVTKSDNTWVHILGFSPFRISKTGKSTEHRVDWEMHSSIRTSKPVLIVQIISVDLYNDTTAVTGHPALLLVPNINQWSDNLVYSDCLVQAEDESVITVIAYDSDKTSIPWINPIDTAKYDWIGIVGTDYAVLTVLPESGEERQHGGKDRFSYGYCNGTAAFLLDAKWEWESEKCVPSIPVPGDGVDNNCNGQIDEETCTDADRDIVFTSTQDSSTGAITYRSASLKWRDHVSFTVKSCDIAAVTLRTDTDPEISLTAHILPGFMIIQICAPDCTAIEKIDKAGANCTDTQQYDIGWKIQGTDTVHVFVFGSDEVTVTISNQLIYYDVMFAYAFVGSADFVIHVPEKDCDKILSGDADNFGKTFIVALKEDDMDFLVYITNINNVLVSVSIQIDSGKQFSVDIQAKETHQISKASLSAEKGFSQAVFSRLKLEATDEVSVYVLRQDKDVGLLFGHPIIPVDVLGPYYQLFLEGTIADSTATVCTVHSIEYKAKTNAGDDPIISTFDITKEIYDNALRHQHLLESNLPVAVFCGSSDNMAQMPPRETLGTQHYIPKLDLTSMAAEAEIRLVATEDSTVVIIRGNYDQLDTVSLTGRDYSRAFETNTLYDISATKPIQVQLQIRSTSPEWRSLVVIPPITQYKKKHFFPAFPTSFFDSSSAVDASGSMVTSQVTEVPSTLQEFTYGSPTFSLTILKHEDFSDNIFIVPSDVMFQDVNQVCIRSDGEPGDGKDNDCDGLIDEEQCSDEMIPGAIDADIDGSMNEDCANNTSANPTTPIQLSLSSVPLAQCPTDPGNINTGGNGAGGASITINNGVVTNSVSISPVPDVETSSGTEATYAYLKSSSIIVQNIPTTTPAPGSTVAPEENCFLDYICPCGWVYPPKNFTPEELQVVIAEIQAKLLIPKLKLSATIRAKTSATDNRAEATAVGYVGICFLVTMVGALVLLDLTSIARDCRRLISNIREVFQP